jgi:hypothetical protein
VQQEDELVEGRAKAHRHRGLVNHLADTMPYHADASTSCECVSAVILMIPGFKVGAATH